MALYTYGGTPADVLTDTAGNVVPDYLVLVYRAGTAEQITALYEADGVTPIAELRTNSAVHDQPGAIRVFKVDDATAIDYSYNGTGGPVRWYQAARELAQEASTAAADALKKSEGGIVSQPTTFSAGLAVEAGLDVTGGATTDGLDVQGDMTVTGTLTASDLDLSAQGLYHPDAAGDGVTDDAPAIQSALSAAFGAGGGQVVIPPGDYLLETLPLRIYRNVRLTLLPGARMLRGATGTMLLNGDAEQSYGGYTGHGNILIEGGEWDCLATTFSTSAMCISLGHAENVTIRDTVIRDVCGFHGIEINAVKTARISRVHGLGYLDPGGRDFSEFIQPDLAKGSAYFGGFGPYDDTPCTDILIEGCTIGASGTAGTVAWPRGIGSHSTSPDKPHTDIRIHACQFEDGAQYAIGGYAWEGVTIEGVQIRDCGAGIRLRTLDSSNASHRTPAGAGSPSIAGSQPLRGVTITGCEISGTTGYDDCVSLFGESDGQVINAAIVGNVLDGNSSGSQNGVRLEYVEDYTIGDNVVRDTAGTGVSQEQTSGGTITGNRIRDVSGSGVACTTCSDVTIAANAVYGAGVNGVHVLGGSDVAILDNQIRAADSYGIRLSTSAADPLIDGNKIRAAGGTATYGIGITNTCTGVVRGDNDITSSGSTGELDDQSSGRWTAPTLVNSWADLGGAWQVAEYRKDLTGRVWIRGLITGGAAGATAFTLPAGFRPPADFVTTALSSGGNPPSLCRLQVNADGTVVPQNVVTSFVVLDVCFDTV